MTSGREAALSLGGRFAVALGALALLLSSVGATAHASVAAPAPCATPHPWCDTSLGADRRTALLIAAMTQTDKENVVSNNAVVALGIPAAVANFTDGPVGAPAGTNSTQTATGLPSASALGATFDAANAALYGQVTGNDARLYGYDGIWGPTLNTLRTPLAGRGEEYFGEDPYLISRMAVAEVNAEQAQGEMVQIKHFAANDQEGQNGVPIFSGSQGGRMTVNVKADERTLREIYLAPFDATIAEADPASVMCSYNRLNDQYACESPHLLTSTLRHDWHFPGFVAPDFGADKNFVADFNAGMDTGYRGPAQLEALFAAGVASPAMLDEHVRHVLRTFFAHGVFDRAPYTDLHRQIDVTGQQASAQHIEEQGATLLVNRDHTLPLDGAHLRTIAVIGSAADRYVRGSGSPEVAPFFHQTLLQGIQARAGGAIRVVYDDGTNAASAAAVARSADVAIVSAADSQTEGTDKVCMALDCPSLGLADLQNNDSQMSVGMPDELIGAVAQAQPKTVVVLQTGSPVLTPWRHQVGALLEAWYPGEAGGTAIARVLFGDSDAAGRLPSTFPVSDQDGPATSATKDPGAYPGDTAQNEAYKEGVLVGYRWFDAKGIAPAFPFGYGLSYTQFSMHGLSISARPDGPGATVSIDVTNTGARSGLAVPELYLGLPSPSAAVTEPPVQLKGFSKISLAPGQTQRVSFVVSARDLSYWDTASSSWQIAPGCAKVMIGASSRDIAAAGVLSDGGAACSGPAVPAAAGGGSSGQSCPVRREVSFGLHHARHARVVDVKLYVDGHLERHRRGHSLHRVTLSTPPPGVFRIKIISSQSTGVRWISKRTYRGCVKGSPRTRGLHPRRRRVSHPAGPPRPRP